jgi:hypothetical protein
MENDVVTIEVAKQLKEKGFREKVYAYYNRRGQFFEIHPKQDMNDSMYGCSAPTIHQVLGWLWKEHKIHIETCICSSGFFYDVYQNVEWQDNMLNWDNMEEEPLYAVETPETAYIAAIEYVVNEMI